jgi:hypothetical protein
VVDFYNLKLKELCNDEKVEFIDINRDIYLNELHAEPKSQYISEHVHLNHNIQPLVEECLRKAGYDVKTGHNENLQWVNSEVQGKYHFDPRFGCFVVKDVAN